MPHEKVKFYGDVFINDNNLLVNWNRNRLGMGWVQVAVVPPGWKDTGDWHIVDMSVEDIERTIKLLKKAKKQLQEEVDWNAIVAPKIGKKVRVVDNGTPWTGKITWADERRVGVSDDSWQTVVSWKNIEYVDDHPPA